MNLNLKLSRSAALPQRSSMSSSRGNKQLAVVTCRLGPATTTCSRVWRQHRTTSATTSAGITRTIFNQVLFGSSNLLRTTTEYKCQRGVAMKSQEEPQEGKQLSESEQEQMRLAKEAYDKSMADPKMKAQMESMQKVMSDPKMQEQMQNQAAAFQDPAFKAKIEQMKDDPEFKDMFDELKKGGMGALMKFWNDPVLLKKFNDKLGMSVGGGGAGAGAGAGAGPPGAGPGQEPVVEDLLSAAKYGDAEAVEDYIAIGKDVNEVDDNSRAPLHFAAGSGNIEIANLLLEAGANVDSKDTKMNTPLHYSTGYGHVDMSRLLVENGSVVSLQNANGKKPKDLASLNPENPILKDEDLMTKLSKSTFVET
jgi:hypothetical protein